jgi:hypothetical protein
MTQMPSTESADLAALVRYGCYQRIWQMVRSCRQLAMTPDRQAAYERVERAVLALMDEEWPQLAGEGGKRATPEPQHAAMQ